MTNEELKAHLHNLCIRDPKDEDIIRASEKFIDSLKLDEIGVPDILMGDFEDEVSFYWGQPGEYLVDMGVNGKGLYNFFTRFSEGEFFGDEIKISDGLTEEIKKALIEIKNE